jgi:uncharacterized protein (DUF433 family)
MAIVAPSHIVLDSRGVAWIDETNIKVLEVALESMAHSFTPDEIHDQHDGALTLGQIHAALSWYHDHKADIDAEIQAQLQRSDELRSRSPDSPGRQRLRDQGRLP